MKGNRGIFSKYFSSKKQANNDMSVEDEVKEDISDTVSVNFAITYSCDLMPNNLLESINAHDKNS